MRSTIKTISRFAILGLVLSAVPGYVGAETQPQVGFGQVGELGGGGGAHPSDTTLALDDDVQFQLGTGTDVWFEWDTATTPDQLSLNNTDCDGIGGDCVLFYTEVGSPNLFLKNGEFINNETDGIITLGGSGGTNNENLTIDFEAGANQLALTSSTGVSVVNLPAFSLAVKDVYSVNTGYLGISSRFVLRSPVSGQLQVEDWITGRAVVLDVDDAADTVVIRDKAGTGNGNLTVTGLSTLTGGAVLPVQTAATPAAPATCDASAKGRIEVVDDSDDGAATQVCYCGMTNDSTYDWLNIADNTACTFY